MADNEVLDLENREPDEEYEIIAVDDLDRVKLGRQGENDTQTVRIDCNDWLVQLQGCTFVVVALRPGEVELYVPDITVSNGLITWPITAQDTACAGAGRAEVRALKGDKVKKSKLFRTWIEPALEGDTSGTPTTPPNWVKETADNLARANTLMADALEAANTANQAAENLSGEVEAAKTDALDAIAAAKEEAQEAATATMDDIGDTKEAAIEAIQAAQLAAVEEAAQAMGEVQEADVAAAEAAMEEAKQAKLEEIAEAKTNAEQIAGSAVEIAQAASATAVQALEKAANAENDSATFATDIDELKTGLQKYNLESGSYFGGAFLDEDTNTLYFTDKDGRVIMEIENIGRGGGGGGGGGDSGSNSKISMTNISGWQSMTLAQDDDGNVPACPVTFIWSSLENDMPTGNGSLRISRNDKAEAMLEVPQGENTIDVAPYLKSGANMFDFTVYDIYGKNRSIRFTVDLKVMYISSTFDNTQPQKSAFPFPYTPNGSVRKVVHFEMDGVEIGTVETSVNGHQQSYTIPQQAHGAHVLRVWFVAEINGQSVKSNVLYYEFIAIDPLSTAPIIVSNFDRTTVQQYETLSIDYNVYDPMNLETAVTIEVDGVKVSSLTATRETQTFTYRVSRAGALAIAIKAGETTKTIALDVTESEVHPEAVTDQLSLYLDAEGRSNSENDPAVWEYGTGSGKIAATFDGFNWTRDGWQRDDNGQTFLRTLGGCKVEIPAKVYSRDFRASGKTIEIEFMSHNVLDYETPIISCMSGNRGFEIYADHAVFKSARAEVNCRYTTDRRTRLTLAVQPQSENRLVYLYIDGIYQGISQYSSTDSFQQADPVGITIGDAACGADVYCIRVYDRWLTGEEVLGNYIADRQDAFEMLSLYQRNDIFENSKITISKLPKDLPYVILTGPESPQYKGDKKSVAMVYDEPTDTTRHLTAEGVQVNVQGTSSQYYAVKNLKITFKNGATVNGHLVAGFTIRAGSIMVDTFTLKADFASSESANNIVLAKLFDDLSRALGLLTPPQVKNKAVRQGMDGFPCVVFWDYGDGPEFMGKFNFNNDKGTPDTFGFVEGDQIWDVRNFDSQLSKFHTNVFDENWTNEYESIYPEEYFDPAKLQEMTDFIYGTWQEAATGDALPTPVTYDGVTYSTDTAAYRLAKFKAGYGDLYDLDNAAFYYVFTLVMLLADNRQKNEHLAWFKDLGKWWELPYDFDTALGTDNRGKLTFDYWMEDIDQVNGGNVYNGQDNVKWVNWRQAFWKRSADMYQRMRSSGLFSAEYIKRIFHEWQAAWPEAVWNEDGDVKYVAQVRKDDNTGDLNKALGDKRGQRDEFLDWRFPYCDSLFDMGDALRSILFRPYYNITEEQRASGDYDVIVEYYKNGYVTVMWDDHKTGGRVLGGDMTMRCANPYTYANDAVCAIHNAKMVKDVRGMENLFVRAWDSSEAVNLEAVRLGSGKAGYRNEVTREVSVGANRKLLLVDLRNCVNFGTDDQKTLTLSQCPNLKTVYMEGTQAQGVDLPNGGILETLHLPATTSSLVIRNQPRLTDSGLQLAGWDNIDQLWLENMTGLDSKAIFNRVPTGTAIRITGFWWEAADAAEIDAIMDRLDTMRGIDINGQGQSEEVDDAQMSGTIHATALRGDDIARWLGRYPTIKVIADHTSSTLTVKTWDGSANIGDPIPCEDGVPTRQLPAVPARTSTAQYDYTAVGYSREMDASTAQSDAGTNVLEDRTIYAAYSRTVRSYTVTWANDDNSTLATETYQYGQRPSYKGTTPTSAIDSSRPFTRWTPDIVDVTGPATYKASYIPIYTATFVRASEDGGGTLHTADFQDGQTVTYGGATPTSTREGYTFNGWTPALGVIHANTTYTAKFKAPSDAPTATTADGAYGVEWDYSGTATTLTRKGLAASFSNPTPATAVDGSGSSPFDTIAPWKDMKRYNVVNGTLVPDTDAGFNEANNDTVVYIPEFYYTAYKDTANSKWLWAISPTALPGYKKHPGSGVYVGRFHTGGDSSAVFTKGGVNPLVKTTRANFRTYSAAKGTGWHQIDLATWSAIQMLYLVEYANWHSQDTLGTGQNSGSIKATGATTGAAFHTLKRDGNSNMYRWIENPFSNVLTWVDGFVANNQAAYVSTDKASYGESTSGMEAAGITLPSSEYITGLGYSEKCAWAFIPDTASGGSANTYVTDRVSSSGGVHLVAVGGDCASYDGNGVFYYNASWYVSGTDNSLGSRLLYQP